MAGNLAMMTSRTKKRTSKFWPVLWVGDQVLKKKYCMVRIPTKSPFAHFVTLLHQHTVRPSPVRHPERPRETHPACAEPGTAASRTKPNPKNKKDLVKILPQRVWESDGRTFYTFWHLASRFLPFLAGTWAPCPRKSLPAHLILKLCGLDAEVLYLETPASAHNMET